MTLPAIFGWTSKGQKNRDARLLALRERGELHEVLFEPLYNASATVLHLVGALPDLQVRQCCALRHGDKACHCAGGDARSCEGGKAEQP